ncbi:PfkB family carbohydrate kinase [Mediterraneibacter massiliensis]|uniref:PfkB family carbohydrate kinase n=1 Tax=Mediterraneibacter massiliensis TaxID=1720300 RepID=UPI0022E7141B|nr:PfkB family carbohydrate kinase [Mediterraneibacter massiliensis]
MKKRPRIVGIGIATMDIYCHQKRMYPGGNEYNIAYDAKMQGADTGFMGIFANDTVGDILEKTLIDAKIDTSHSHHEVGASGYALVDLKDGDRVFLDWNKKGVTDLYPFTFTEEEIQYIKTFDIACISWGARVNEEKIKKLSDAGVSICYDFYDNFQKEDIEAISPYIKYGFLSCSHVSLEQTKEILRKCVSLGCKIAIGTRGGNPTIAFDGENFYEKPICRVKAKDTMGAGDSYISAFLTNYLLVEADESISTGDKINTSLEKAAEFAATVVMKDGALGIGYDVDPDKLSEIVNV